MTTYTPVYAPAFAAESLPLYVGSVTPRTPETVMPAATQAALNRLYRTAPVRVPVRTVATPAPRPPVARSPFAPTWRTRLASALRPRFAVSDRALGAVALALTAFALLLSLLGRPVAPVGAQAPASTQSAQYASEGYYHLCEGTLSVTETATTRTTVCVPTPR